jgi:hypothetical protein
MDPTFFGHDDQDLVSPLRPFRSLNMPPPTPDHHASAAKGGFEHITSKILRKSTPESSKHCQSRSFAPSPLDTIPPSLSLHFPRFSITTENSTPDLSTEEVTSTRLSIDKHAIMQALEPATASLEVDWKRWRLNITLHKAISTPSLSLKLVKDRLRKPPSSTLSENTLRQDATATSEQKSPVRGKIQSSPIKHLSAV